MTGDAPVLWREASQILSRTLSQERLRTWVLPLMPVGLENGTLRLAAPNEFLKQGIDTHYMNLLREALTQAAGRKMHVALEVDPSLQFVGDEEVDGRRSTPHLNPEFTFETFVVGPCNRLAHASAIAATGASGKLYNPLFIYGAAGVGKTHLLQAICHKLLSDRPGLSLLYMPCEMFINEYIAALEADRMADFHSRFHELDVLAMDNVYLLATRPRTQEEFFHAFNLLYDAGRQIVLSSTVAPHEIESLEQRLVSRFTWGLVARIEQPVFETRAAMIRKKIAARGLSVAETVVHLLADLPCRNVRELEASLTRVLAYSSLSGRNLDAELAAEALTQRDAFRKRPALDDIIDLVTEHFGVPAAELLSKKRARSLVIPRQICMYLARRLTKHSLEEIGKHFGGRDHTTVMHAFSRVGERANGDHLFRKLLLDLESKLLLESS